MNGMCLSQSGNLFTTGIYSGNATFDNIALTHQGNSDIFIASQSLSETYNWAKSAPGIGVDKGTCIATLPSQQIAALLKYPIVLHPTEMVSMILGSLTLLMQQMLKFQFLTGGELM